MNAPNDNTAAKGLRGWWQTPPRPGLQRLINPWEFRHLRAFGLTRIVLDYLWGKPAQQAIPALLTARSDRSRELNWIQIGSVAGPAMELPSAALRSANFRLQGSGQGSVSPRPTSPSCRRWSPRSPRVRSRSWPPRCRWPMWSRSGPGPRRQRAHRPGPVAQSQVSQPRRSAGLRVAGRHETGHPVR